jgi:secreted Zn-dependent insulinase-like peptidase
MINDLLQQITPDNVAITLTDKGVETDEVSPYYDVPFARHTLTQEQLASWRGSTDSGTFHLPSPNQFIAEDVSLVPEAEDAGVLPAVALQTERQKIWFKKDTEFRVPKGATYINFRSPEVGQSAEQTALAVLYTALLKDDVNEYAYPALLAGLNFDFYKHAQGISLRITGYSDKQALLLSDLLSVVAEADFSPLRFENIRQDMIRALRNTVAKRPSSQVIDDLRESLLYGEWGEQAVIDALEQTDLEAVQAYVRRFWASTTAEVMIYGNYEPGFVNQVSAMLDRVVPGTPPPALPDLRVLKLAPGESLLYEVDVPHEDSVVAWYLQGAGDSWRDRAATQLTAQIMKSGFFQQLRTEQQLGYVASAFAWPQLEVPGLVMLIQSPVADAETVYDAMRAFMESVTDTLDKEQFARHQAALVSDILQPDKNLWERANFYWQSIALKQFQFDGRQQLADAVEAFNLDSWKAYYEQVFMDQRHSLLVLAPGGKGAVPEGEFQIERSAAAIKQGHEVYLIN